MLGSVWYQVSVRGSRRPWLLLLRCGYAAGQLVLYCLVLRSALSPAAVPFGADPEPQSVLLIEANRLFLRLWLWLQLFAAVALAVPLVAGEVAREKERGTLALLLTTHLGPAGIVLGKLLGRGLQLLTLLLAGLPLFCFAATWAGLPPHYVVAQAVLLVLWVYALAALALLASVWGRTTRGAIGGLFVWVGVTVTVLLAAWLGLEDVVATRQPPWAVPPARAALLAVRFVLDCLNPLTLLQAADGPVWGGTLAGLVLFHGGLGSVCLLLAVWRLRPAFLRSLEQPARKDGRWRARPAPGDEPVRWREQHVAGLVSGRLLQWLPRWLPLAAVALTGAALGWQVFGELARPAGRPSDHLTESLFVIAVLGVVTLIACVRSAETISAERERRTWETLLLTPLTDEELIRQKFRGILGAITAPVVAFTVPGFLAAVVVGAPAAWLAVLALLPLHLWFVQRCTIAVGLLNSAGASGPWGSMWGTLLLGGGIVGTVYGLAGGCGFGLASLAHDYGPPRGGVALGFVVPLVVASVAICLLLETGTRMFLHSAMAELAMRDRAGQRAPQWDWDAGKRE